MLASLCEMMGPVWREHVFIAVRIVASPVTTSPATGYATSCAGPMSGKTSLHLLCDKSLIVVGNCIDRMTNFTDLATSRIICLLQVADQSGTGLIV